jgi:molybdate transport system substrate-binding protein
MHKQSPLLKSFLFFILLFANGTLSADEIRVAVASNFITTIKPVVTAFETITHHKVILISGSTGKHYAQIKNGAPFDAFFAADTRRPQLLEEEALTVANSRFTYAIGKLILWSPKNNYINSTGDILQKHSFRHIAIANPKLAPYGKAAEEVLRTYNVWHSLKRKIVRGENIGQTFQFVKSGNAELGFISYSQIKHSDHPISGSWWNIPQSLYTPIEQQAVLLKDTKAARDFLSFIKSEKSLAIIRSFGYATP